MKFNEKKIKLEFEQQADASHQNKLEICSFVKQCSKNANNAKKKKIIEIASKSLTISLDNTFSGMRNFYIAIYFESELFFLIIL